MYIVLVLANNHTYKYTLQSIHIWVETPKSQKQIVSNPEIRLNRKHL